MRRKEIPILPYFGYITMKELVFSQNCLTTLTNATRDRCPEISRHEMGKQSAEITTDKPKSPCLQVFLMVTEQVAKKLP